MKALAEEDPLLRGIYWVQDAGACSGVYILEEGRTLIDVGNMYGLLDEMAESFPPERLERILLTHSHFDHVGGMAEVYQSVSPTLYVHPLSRGYLSLHRHPFPEFFEALEQDGKLHRIDDGDVIDGDPPLRVIHTPGHTAGDVCFFDERSGALFCGDTVLPFKLQLGAALSKPDAVCGGRLQDKRESLKKLLALPVRHLMAGHGEPVLHKGLDQIKLSLFSFHKSMHEGEPAQAWVAMGHDMLDLGAVEDARQCAAKAFQEIPDSLELQQLKERIERAGKHADHT